jgi:hypothetical protein
MLVVEPEPRDASNAPGARPIDEKKEEKDEKVEQEEEPTFQELEDKMFFVNYLLGVKKTARFYNTDSKNAPLYDPIQQEKASIKCIQFHSMVNFI